MYAREGGGGCAAMMGARVRVGEGGEGAGAIAVVGRERDVQHLKCQGHTRLAVKTAATELVLLFGEGGEF